MTGTASAEFSLENVGPINWGIIARRIAWPEAISLEPHKEST